MTTTWDKCCETVLSRGDRRGEQRYLERGVNFFVLMLERQGCEERCSGEGHPHGFFIELSGDYTVVVRVVRAGYFDVHVTGQPDVFRLLLPAPVRWAVQALRLREDEEEKRTTLRLAAAAWEREFGSLP